MNRKAVIAWIAVVVPVWLVFVLCTHWEPVLRDGWGHFIWHRHNDVSLGGVWDFAKGSYLHNNPRLGQTFTLLMHTPGPYHAIVTPLVELALFYLLAILALGRWPSLRRTSDALLVATIIALVFACARSLGPMLFYRPFTGNYLFGLVVNLIWLVPYRLHGEDPRRRGWWWTPLMLVLGLASGLCNEHTGPGFAVAGLFALVIYWRRGERFVPWAIAGLIGLAAGGLLLLYAPGQEIRYNGLATQLSPLQRIVDRGARGNGKILFLLVLYLLPSVLWLALGVVARLRGAGERQPRNRALAQLAVAGLALLIVVTLLASPKQGDRLYFAPICLACAALAGWLIARLGRPERIVAAALAAITITYTSYRLVTTYHSRGSEFVARMAVLEYTPPNGTATVAPYSDKRSRWVIGDDFVVDWLRGAIAREFQIATIQLTTSPTGSADSALDDP